MTVSRVDHASGLVRGKVFAPNIRLFAANPALSHALISLIYREQDVATFGESSERPNVLSCFEVVSDLSCFEMVCDFRNLAT
jgi:hypothetical protein